MTEERMALAELLQKSGDGDFLRTVAEAVLQILMEADVEGLIGAGRHERLYSGVSIAQVPGVAQGIPEPEHRNVIVQLFNWRFDDVRQVIPTLRQLGYSHVHVSPPEKSNER